MDLGSWPSGGSGFRSPSLKTSPSPTPGRHAEEGPFEWDLRPQTCDTSRLKVRWELFTRSALGVHHPRGGCQEPHLVAAWGFWTSSPGASGHCSLLASDRSVHGWKASTRRSGEASLPHLLWPIHLLSFLLPQAVALGPAFPSTRRSLPWCVSPSHWSVSRTLHLPIKRSFDKKNATPMATPPWSFGSHTASRNPRERRLAAAQEGSQLLVLGGLEANGSCYPGSLVGIDWWSVNNTSHLCLKKEGEICSHPRRQTSDNGS